MSVTYEWDERKRRSNLQRHHLDFRDAWVIYEHPDKMTLSSPYPDEPRLIDMAEVNGIVWLFVYTERGQAVRCISFRQASRKERGYYYDEIQRWQSDD